MKSCYLLAIPILASSLGANAEVTLDGTLGRGGALPGPDYLIGADLGRQHGGNLFHSFQDFNLSRFESATFSGTNSINNIINRVTGGNPSNIDGLIRSTIPANMYFLNPNGIMFGPNARLDVQSSFHASTADYLRLGNGGRFDARNPGDSLLTVAPIESFGFLNGPIAPISVQGHGEVSQYLETGLSVPEGQTLSLIGGKIDIRAGTFFKTVTIDDEGNGSTEITRLPILAAPSGRINLASVASQGEVKLGENFVDVGSISNLADIHLTEKSPIATSGEGGGSIFIRSGQFFADDSAIEAKTLGSKDGGVIDIRADAISLINGAALIGNTEGTGKGSSIYMQATESITVAGEHNDFPGDIAKIQISGIYARSGIYEELTDDNLGDAGEIDLEAKNILFKDGATISVSTYGGGKGGDMRLKASESVSVVGEASDKYSTIIAAATYSESDGAGEAGSLLIEAQNISVTDGAYISLSTKGKGKGGSVTLKASDTVAFKGESSEAKNSHVELITTYEGDGAGDSGTLLVEAQNISVTDGAYIDSSTGGKGNAGTVTLHANNRLKLTGVDKNGYGSQIFTLAISSMDGNAGDIFVKAQDVLLTDGAYLISSSGSSGKAGNIHVNATGTITIAGTNKNGWRSVISSSSNPKREGIIGGKGGNVTIEANQLIIKDGGGIAASSIAPKGMQSGKGGNITIRVQGAVELSGVNPHGENEDGFGAGIYVRSIGIKDNAGDAGTVMLQAGSLIIRDGAVIMSSTNNNAQGGNIDIDVRGTVTITGDASNIPLREPASAQLEYLQGFSPSKYNQSTSGIHASSEGKTEQAGQGGNITLSAQNLTLTNKGKISTSSAGGGKAGNIIIEVAQLQLDSRASIASESSLSNVYDFTNLAERDSHILIAGNIVKVADVGNGKSGRYINTGGNLIRTTPVYTVADLTALQQLSNQYDLAKGNMVEVRDIGNGQSARFIYVVDFQFGLSEWIKISNEEVTVTLTLENMLELEQRWYSPSEDIPYNSGEVIKVTDVGNGKPATFIYATLLDPVDAWTEGLVLRVNQFTVTDTAKLNELSETNLVQAGDTANVMNVNSRFVFNGQSWSKLNNPLMVADIAAMNALTIAQTGNVAKIAQAESGQPSRFIYSGQQWLPMNKAESVANLAELNQLPAKPGDLVGVIDAGNGQHEHFFYADGEWKKQVRGGDAGQIVIKADQVQLSNNSEIATASVSGGGGTVTLNVNDLVYLNNSQVSTSVQQSVGNGGNLTIFGPQFVVMNDGKIIAQANEGRGGNIQLGTKQLIKSPCSEISASSKLGIDGNVQIDSPAVDMDAMLVVLPGGFIEEAELPKPCQFQDVSELSTFKKRTTREGMPMAPSGFQE
jgi:filamentous hemagglutinin family protein